ncbi:MAG: 5-formyltetrahydrofolate cyclo-ligase [Candidatus Coproplasma sp.]
MREDLRYKYKIKRKYFQYSRREVADGAIADCIFAAFGDKQKYFIYYSFGSEADTHAIIQELLSRGKEVYLPRVEGNDMVAVRYAGDSSSMVVNKLGIAEPMGESYSGDFDLIIAPLLAVNSRGFRLGYGGGYYDRFLKERTSPVVGIGYAFQLTDEFEESEWDVPLSYFICERGIYDFVKS